MFEKLSKFQKYFILDYINEMFNSTTQNILILMLFYYKYQKFKNVSVLITNYNYNY